MSEQEQEPVSIHAELAQCLAAHGLDGSTHNDWVVPNGELPAIRGTWFPRETGGRLDIEILLKDERMMVECFAGLGNGGAGLVNGFTNFTANSLHPMLAAIWGVENEEQVTTESWQVGGKNYTAYLGGLGQRTSQGYTPKLPPNLFDSIEALIKSTSMEHRIHWIRHFFCNISPEQQVYESLLDNDVWEAGEENLKELDWHKPETFYSVRHFMILVPA